MGKGLVDGLEYLAVIDGIRGLLPDLTDERVAPLAKAILDARRLHEAEEAARCEAIAQAIFTREACVDDSLEQLKATAAACRRAAQAFVEGAPAQDGAPTFPEFV